MWSGFIIIAVSCAVGLTAQAVRAGGPKAGPIWGAVHFALTVILSLVSEFALRPNLFPSWLIEGEGVFDQQLTHSEKVLSFLLDKLFAYGPLALVTIVIVLFVCLGTPKDGGGRIGAPKRDWKSSLR